MKLLTKAETDQIFGAGCTSVDFKVGAATSYNGVDSRIIASGAGDLESLQISETTHLGVLTSNEGTFLVSESSVNNTDVITGVGKYDSNESITMSLGSTTRNGLTDEIGVICNDSGSNSDLNGFNSAFSDAIDISFMVGAGLAGLEALGDAALAGLADLAGVFASAADNSWADGASYSYTPPQF